MDCKQYQQYTLNEANDENSKKTKEWIDVSKYLFLKMIRNRTRVDAFVMNNV